MTLVITSVTPATDTEQAMVKARSTHYGTFVWVPFDHSKDQIENHALAARILCVRLNADGNAAFRGTLDTVTLVGDAPFGPRKSWAGYAFNATSSMSRARVWDV